MYSINDKVKVEGEGNKLFKVVGMNPTFDDDKVIYKLQDPKNKNLFLLKFAKEMK